MLHIEFTPVLDANEPGMTGLSSGTVRFAGEMGECAATILWLVPFVDEVLSSVLTFLAHDRTAKQISIGTYEGHFGVKFFRKNTGLIRLYCHDYDSDRLIAHTNAEELRGVLWEAAYPLYRRYREDVQTHVSAIEFNDTDFLTEMTEALNQWQAAFPELHP